MARETRDVNNQTISLSSKKIFEAFLQEISTFIASECRADVKREKLFHLRL